MSDYTANEVITAIEKIDTVYDSWWHDLEIAHLMSRPVTLNIRNEDVPLDVVVIEAESEGDAFAVVKIGDQLFRQEGYYSSHSGTDWDGRLREVEAYQELVTFYRNRRK